MIFITKEQIILLHEGLIRNFGGSPELRDESLLDSAINTPFQTYDGLDLYPEIYQKASRLAYGLIRNHPFVDGNKRIGAHVMLLFLEINNVYINYEDDELIKIILSIASGKSTDKDLSFWIKNHIVE